MKPSIVVILVTILVVSAGSYFFVAEKELNTAQYFLENESELDLVLAECDELDPKAMLSDRNCLNAIEAKSLARRKKFIGSYKPSTHPGVPLNSY